MWFPILVRGSWEIIEIIWFPILVTVISFCIFVVQNPDKVPNEKENSFVAGFYSIVLSLTYIGTISALKFFFG